MCFRPPSAMKVIVCPNCGAKNPDTSSQCHSCNEPLPELPPDEEGSPSIAPPAAPTATEALKPPSAPKAE